MISPRVAGERSWLNRATVASVANSVAMAVSWMWRSRSSGSGINAESVEVATRIETCGVRKTLKILRRTPSYSIHE